jgi:surface antigen
MMTNVMRLGTSIENWPKFSLILALSVLLAGCNTTSGSTRLDQAGEELAATDVDPDQPENATFYIQALRGGLMARIAGLKISKSDRARALEAEYKALETSPGGQKIVWDGAGGVHGEVVAATPYQVGSQNCRQYTHSISVKGAAPLMARGAACRNANGSWTPLT